MRERVTLPFEMAETLLGPLPNGVQRPLRLRVVRVQHQRPIEKRNRRRGVASGQLGARGLAEREARSR